LGLRQRDLAAQLKVREETLAAWERGRAWPLARHVDAVVVVLGYDPAPAGDALAARLNATQGRRG
jgi:transcriptional regulator with XRE-family HTH domain